MTVRSGLKLNVILKQSPYTGTSLLGWMPLARVTQKCLAEEGPWEDDRRVSSGVRLLICITVFYFVLNLEHLPGSHIVLVWHGQVWDCS